ncbi:hypothetical protein L3Q82_006816 [Scortum barcoo]|uniref:Uncharacterized protein n=1 Tax=Scortum barcoo TaxID=214431 RepID=A0ACB8WZ19_9TELE|nr:hypothetical protein L3Q82_006816 [Scortum barcoo]
MRFCFCPGRGTLDQLYTLHRVLEGLWEFAQPVHVHVLCESGEGIRPCTSIFKAMVLDRKRVACPLRVGGEVLPQVEEFKYLGVLFTSEGKMEREIDRRIGAVSAVMRSVYRTVVVKKELSRKANAHPHLWS